MPYCTIEEAWKTTLNPNLENCEKSSKGYDNEKEYYNINLPNSEIYNEKGEEGCKDKALNHNLCKAGFEPAHPKIRELESPALDHSAICAPHP